MTEAAVILEYQRFAYWLARDYYLPGADRDDINQEALIGLLKAWRSYDPTLGMSFKNFAALAIRRDLEDAVQSANALKHRALNASDRETDAALSVNRTPHEVVADRQEFRALIARIKLLTPLERASLVSVVFEGHSYVSSYVKEKQIDNAIQRARLKLRRAA